MTSNFANRYVAITPEHTTNTGARSYGTKSAMTHKTGSAATAVVIFGEVDDESVAYNFDLMNRADMSRYAHAKSVNGKEYSEGGLNLVMQPDDFLGYLIYGLYGDNVACDSDGYAVSGFVHTFKEENDLILPSFTLEVGREEKEHTYTGMCMSSLSISASHGEYATISADFTGKSESALSNLVAAPTFVGAALDGFHFAEGTVEFSDDGAASSTSANVKSISLEFTTNLDTDAACSIGSRTYLRQPQPQMREITGTVEFSTSQDSVAETNTPDYETALSTGGKIFDGALAHPAVQLTFTNGSQSLEIGIQKVRWEAPQSNVSGRDTSTLTMSFVAMLDVGTGVMSQMVLTHTTASSVLSSGIKYSKV